MLVKKRKYNVADTTQQRAVFKGFHAFETAFSMSLSIGKRKVKCPGTADICNNSSRVPVKKALCERPTTPWL